MNEDDANTGLTILFAVLIGCFIWKGYSLKVVPTVMDIVTILGVYLLLGVLTSLVKWLVVSRERGRSLREEWVEFQLKWEKVVFFNVDDVAKAKGRGSYGRQELIDAKLALEPGDKSADSFRFNGTNYKLGDYPYPMSKYIL